MFQVQHEIIAAWLYTVNHQLGLFHVTKKPTSPLVSEQHEGENEIQNTHCGGESMQDVWLQFMTKQYKATRYYSKEQVRQIMFHSVF